MRKVLVVDDVEINRELLVDILGPYYDVITATNGQEAIDLIKESEDGFLIMLDLMMPVIDGFGVLEFLNDFCVMSKFPVIIISGDSDAETEAKCFDYGISDFVAKPFNPKIVLRRVNNIMALNEYQNRLENRIINQNKELVKQNEQLSEQATKLAKMNDNIIDVLGNMVESRNLESGTHVMRVKLFTQILGIQLMKDYPEYGLTVERVKMISQAAALHDIGKIAISDNILLKPGRLTEDEFEYMKSHTIKGCEILQNIDGIWDDEYQKTSIEICRYHHERFDGKGYPEGLMGDEIPISAQLVSVADVYDALVTERVYKAAFTKDQAYNMIINGECGSFSPKLLRSFEHARPQFEDLVNSKLCAG